MSTPQRGLYVAVDGPDGSGKSSQARWLYEQLDAQGDDVLLVREPGDTDLGDRLREMLLATEVELSAYGEALLFLAARAELVRRVVAPALVDGKTVISDRCFASTLVYQHLALTVEAGSVEDVPSMDLLLQATREAHAPAMPAVVFALDVTAKTARARRSRRKNAADDRFETRDHDFQERVCEGFRSLATRDDVAGLFAPTDIEVGGGVVRIDAERDAATIRNELLERCLALGRSLGRWGAAS